MLNVLILGKSGCMKCEDVKERLFPLRELGYDVEYRHATMKEIYSLKLKTAPVVLVQDNDRIVILLDVGMTYKNVLWHLEAKNFKIKEL
jgi:glutaredoxin